MWQNSRWKLGLLIGLVLLLALGLAACGDDDEKDEGGLTIVDPWVRPTMTGGAMDEGEMGDDTSSDGEMDESEMGDDAADDDEMGDDEMNMGGMMTGAFMTIQNTSKSADRLLSATVSADVASTVEIHETTFDENDVMQMRPVEGVDIPADGNAVLKPGSFHIMLLDVQQALESGDTVDLTLTFESGTEIAVTATVRAIDAAE